MCQTIFGQREIMVSERKEFEGELHEPPLFAEIPLKQYALALRFDVAIYILQFVIL